MIDLTQNSAAGGLLPVRWSFLLGDFFPQKFRSKVSAIFPGNRIVANGKLIKICFVFKRLENWAIKFSGKIDFARKAIIKSYPYFVVIDVFGFYHMWYHRFTPMDQFG